MALPPLDEQRRIAEVLRSVDEAIAFAERAATQARSTLDALLRDHFCSDGGDVSCGNLTPLSDLISLQSGFAFKSQEYQQNGHFLMRISNVQDGQVSLENPKFVTLDRKTQAFELQEGDILTSLTGNIGRVARLTTAHLPAALNQRVARIKPKSEVSVDADYLFFALKSPLFKASLFEESGGAAQQNVSPKAIGRVEIPLPPMEEQRRMGEMLLGIDDVIVQSEGSLEQLQNVKIDLMSDLLAGRVRVPA
jgi:type I restriction enzyme, S subunit